MALCRPVDRSLWGALVAVVALWIGAQAGAWDHTAHAESWCAESIFAHEWGVMVFNGRGEAEPGLVALPSWIEHRAGAGLSATPSKARPVRELPPDGGERDLPVLHFYAPRLWSESAPLGVEVGFKRGVASAWFPRVDGLRSAVEANSPGAQAARERLVKARQSRAPFGGPGEALPSDPTRQLIWEALSLSPTAPSSTLGPEQPWVESLRAIPDALWISNAAQSERFIFYEGRTDEGPLLSLSAPAPSACTCGVQNAGEHPVFDVLIVARAPSGEVRVGWAPRVEAGKSASIPLGSALDPKAFQAATRDHLLAALTTQTPLDGDDGTPAPSLGCVMGRDPALPTEASSGHALYEAEARALVSIWGAHLFDQPGLTVLYRESPAYLDAVMPLSLYTDMFHHITLHRVGLVAQRGLPLGACACEP